MRTFRIILPSPSLDLLPGISHALEPMRVQTLLPEPPISRLRERNDSAKALSVGFPGREKQIRTPLRYAQASNSGYPLGAANSGPLSTQIALGSP